MRTREEQIDSLYHGHNRYSTITQEAFRNHLIEAERRAEQRVRAEIGRDSERLDWVADNQCQFLNYGPREGDMRAVCHSSGEVMATNSDIRQAIDAAREVG